VHPATTHSFKWQKFTAVTIQSADEDVEEYYLSCIATGNEKWCSHVGREISIHLSYDPAIVFLGVYPMCPHKNLNVDVCSRFIHKCQKLEVAGLFFSW
jgi:hypothetical protein